MSDPIHTIIDDETEHLFLCFCTFVTTLKGKKLSLQNILIHVLEEERLRKLLKDILTIDSDYEVISLFLNQNHNISSSKYVTKFLNNRAKNGRPIKGNL